MIDPLWYLSRTLYIIGLKRKRKYTNYFLYIRIFYLRCLLKIVAIIVNLYLDKATDRIQRIGSLYQYQFGKRILMILIIRSPSIIQLYIERN